MAFQVSPGVNVTEIDLTTVIPSIATSTAAFAGEFQWGPVDQIRQMADETQLVNLYYKPNNYNATDFFTCANFLSYGNDLRVVRVANVNTYSAVAAANANSTYTTLAGTVDVTSGSAVVVGSGTAFNTALAVGSTLLINAVTKTVSSITNAEHLIVNSTYSITGTGNTAIKVVDPYTEVQIKNEDQYEMTYRSSGVTNSVFTARYPGALGNSLKVSVFANSAATLADWTYGSLFNKDVSETNWLSTKWPSAANDELHMVVIDEDGLFTGVPNTVLEKYESLSKASNAKDETGQSNYWKDVIFRSSKYIYVTGTPNNAKINGTVLDWDAAATNSSDFDALDVEESTWSLTNGADASATNADVTRGYDYFNNAETLDLALVLTSDHSQAVATHVVNNIAAVRKDCIAFVSPTYANVTAADPTTAITNYRDALNFATSYAVMDGNWKYQYDKYNDLYRFIPMNGDVAGLCARTDTDRDPWFSPAGIVRGQIKNVIKLAYNPSKANRDELYKNDVNPICSFAGEGTILFGDKTMLGRPSAFDRINVRRLFIVLEKSISRAARSSLFEFNDEFTRAQFVNLVEPFLRLVQGRRGITDYRVVCDTTNNTPEVIDRNEFVGDIYVKPAKSINYVQLNFVAVRTGVAFEEIVGRV